MPGASLNSLPSELKTRIVSEHDRWDRMRRRNPAVFWLKAMDSDGRRNCRDLNHLGLDLSAVGALFQVSREWHEIAAVFRFRSLTAKQCADPIYQLSLHLRYGQHVKCLELKEADDVQLPALVASLSLLRDNVEEVYVPNIRNLIENLEEYLPAPYDGASLRHRQVIESALRPLIQRASTIHLDSATIHYSYHLVSGSPLSRLVVAADLLYSKHAFVALLDLIKACPALDELEIGLLEAQDDTLLSETALSRYKADAWPAVRRLSVSLWYRRAHLRLLESLFAPTLTHFSISCWPHELEKMYYMSSTRWPNLRELAVRGTQSATSRLISSITPEAFPALRLLSWESMLSDEGNVLPPALRTQLDALQSKFAFRSPPLEIELREDPYSPVLYPGVREQLDLPPHVRLVAGLPTEAAFPPRTTFSRPRWIADGTTPFDHALGELHNCLDDMHDMIDSAATAGDLAQVAKIAEALQECDFIRYNAQM